MVVAAKNEPEKVMMKTGNKSQEVHVASASLSSSPSPSPSLPASSISTETSAVVPSLAPLSTVTSAPGAQVHLANIPARYKHAVVPGAPATHATPGAETHATPGAEPIGAYKSQDAFTVHSAAEFHLDTELSPLAASSHADSTVSVHPHETGHAATGDTEHHLFAEEAQTTRDETEFVKIMPLAAAEIKPVKLKNPSPPTPSQPKGVMIGGRLRCKNPEGI